MLSSPIVGMCPDGGLNMMVTGRVTLASPISGRSHLAEAVFPLSARLNLAGPL
jgi:hypothetical protein